MPRKSLRKKAIECMEAKVKKLRLDYSLREAMHEDDSSADEKLIMASNKLNRMKRSRYLFRGNTNNYKVKKFDLEDALSFDSVHYNAEKFLYTFRMTRESFFLFLEEMKDKKAFKKKSRSSTQRPVSFQLLVFLCRVGSESSHGGSKGLGIFFGIAKGSVKNYVRRVVAALHEIKEEVVSWPNPEERKAMRNRLSAHGFRHAVGIIDGTLIGLDYRPQAFHECYFSRKCMYALNVLIVCDDKRRIIYYNAGWPGSTHDNRVFRNSNLYIKRGDYFTHREYLLGDSAYSASPIMVQAFKKQVGQSNLPANNEFFNTRLAQVRIVSEHCIGILKGRFKCLKRNNIKIRRSVKEVKELVDLIGACIVMHNLLINYDDDVPDEWYEDIEEDIDWTMYDEEEERIAQVTEEGEDRRQYVYNSLINNYL
jgi:hypothetical protein